MPTSARWDLQRPDGLTTVHAVRADWPLRLPAGLRWAVVAADLIACLATRRLVLGRVRV